ncbi:MAG: putative DNA binding domain-containing protein [Verrucomicrobia bacterium]|nr:putative DNA binding domain-containing protein [Verrucomicrobiota bacterium]MCH8528818.1 putative DNA binding domain-containing protein [Kiritimatiellia bacterium]
MSDSIPELDMQSVRESSDLECKRAGGRDGKGALPLDFWETYSAMANTDGGVVLLGMQQKADQFIPHHIEKPDKVLKDLFDTANNRGKVSINLLSNASARLVQAEGKTLISVSIPRATREQRPVFLNGNPLGNTYIRLHECDQRLTDDAVKRMLAEQQEDSRDTKILKGYTFEDLSLETLRVYRQVFSNRQPRHPWNELELHAFLRQIGAWRKDRESGEEGLTAAGLLMFGVHPAIQEAFPFYMLDYQELPEVKTEGRWIDRVTLDGTWSGNVYDFYRRVYPKLVDGLKVPFELEGDQRKEETAAHEALREALCNVIVHADYSDRCSVFVVKRSHLFGFRNPGLMRIPLEFALQGGHPDCRNRTLHQMFRHVGIGDQSGSGIPTILSGWHKYHWRPPMLEEKREPYDQTLLTMRMIDLFPPRVVDALREHVGESYDQLVHEERVALAVAAVEGTVNHARLCAIGNQHAADATRHLQNLVGRNLLEQTGTSRGAVYHIKGMRIPGPEDVFGSHPYSENSIGLEESSIDLERNSIDLEESSIGLEERNEAGMLISKEFDRPFVDDLQRLTDKQRKSMESLASLPREKRKLQKEKMESVIRELCRGHYIKLGCIAELVDRNAVSLRNQYLNPMKKAQVLKIAFPRTPNDPRQAYTLNEEKGTDD